MSVFQSNNGFTSNEIWNKNQRKTVDLKQQEDDLWRYTIILETWKSRISYTLKQLQHEARIKPWHLFIVCVRRIYFISIYVVCSFFLNNSLCILIKSFRNTKDFFLISKRKKTLSLTHTKLLNIIFSKQI